jgi:hypothetical protein
MKSYRSCLKTTLIVLLGSAIMLFASCKDDDEATKSAACDIVSFEVDAVAWTISGTNITHTYPPETSEDVLTPTITLSPGATISPASGVAQNFFAESGVKYTVTAENGTKKEYTVKATRTKYSGNEIVSFKVDTATWIISGTNITYVYPPDTEEGQLTPTITLAPGATVNPASGVEQNFFAEGGVTYTVTAQDGKTTKTYTAKATRTLSSESEIVSFKVGDDTWTIDGSNITFAYPAGTEEGQLTPTITLSLGATVDPASGVEQNFFAEGGVTYTVTAQDGVTRKTYTAKATKTSSSESEIVSFVVGRDVWTIDGLDITYVYPAGTEEGPLTPTITLSSGATVDPASDVEQNFFTEAGVTYIVTAQDGVTKKTYTVKATVAVSTKRDWVVLPRNGWHAWGHDGEGAYSLETLVWGGGHPMLILDEDLGSGWHSFAAGDSPLPQVLIIDMKDTKTVSKVVGTGIYCQDVELYVTNEPAIEGYETHIVNWENGQGDREAAYSSWVERFKTLIPDNVPTEWGAATTAALEPLNYSGVLNFEIEQYSQFSFTLDESKEGRFLIIRFPSTVAASLFEGATWIGTFSLEVN